MRILISNDDGYQAPGIISLAKALSTLAETTVVAPDRNRSAASNSLTIEYPIRATIQDNGFYRVDGTPTDCVHLAITGLFLEEPDMVISGINDGANMGDDVLYSGTVAAAFEGRHLGYPSIAVSLAGHEPKHFDTAAKVVTELVSNLQINSIPMDSILNINVPDVPFDQIKGIQATRLGQRHKSEPVVSMTDPRGKPIYWVGPPGPEQDAGPGTDFHAVRNLYVSITPLQVDLTRYDSMAVIENWLSGVKL
ncbi:5'-nucleotidase SurE @ Exopolyphosphatase [hydrothermal vent metagenome]|uniref:5'-nucleotidase n=1 Tax=hydrothermal vent metagenome TaxID=652676 RepID=A0A3B1AHV9_9ZZZZ